MWPKGARLPPRVEDSGSATTRCPPLSSFCLCEACKHFINTNPGTRRPEADEWGSSGLKNLPRVGTHHFEGAQTVDHLRYMPSVGYIYRRGQSTYLSALLVSPSPLVSVFLLPLPHS